MLLINNKIFINMNIKLKIKQVLKERYGDFSSDLEICYENKLTENLVGGSIENKLAWLTYNQVILELKHSIKDMLRVKELQYKLTEKCNPNDVCIEVLNEVKNLSPELERLYYKIRNF